MKTAISIVQRIISTFIVNAMAIVGGSALLGGIPVAKSAALAGVSACVTVLERLARASVDGNLTAAEINEAFMGVTPPAKDDAK
jgi:hypothetical protein